ncbi:type II toxin-antitoxin system ParD family antitoxin [Sphingomonas sp. FW199]|uniref:type II toxin-antitoxin system ParD family antitoxin n=1 Tax=Sphingomonas sp. FW199 TaxID=3400217 RepID=UPI003CF8A2B7
MAQMNISLPEKLKGWAERRVAEGRYSSTSDYVRDLIRRDEAEEAIRERERARLAAAWHEGMASGEPQTVSDDWADQVVERGRSRLNPSSEA